MPMKNVGRDIALLRNAATGAFDSFDWDETNNPAFDGVPAYSPEGRQIAFTTDRDGNAEIYVMNANDGTGSVNLTTNRADDSYPAWRP